MLAPHYADEIPEMTVEVAKAAFPKGNVVMTIRDELGPLFADDEFAALYPTIGQPAASPGRLAMVTVLQYLENLTDRQAAPASRGALTDRLEVWPRFRANPGLPGQASIIRC
jgi:transposase